MSIEACAELVARGDPDRFHAAMAGPVEARRVLFALYAFNLEVARAPWVSAEPMIGEMRLQWWRDALEEIGKGGPVRRHEVTTPLAEVARPEVARMLDVIVEARRRDIETKPFADDSEFRTYLGDTGGTMLWAAARMLGAAEGVESDVRQVGEALGFTRFAAALPELQGRGHAPFDSATSAIGRLAEHYIAATATLKTLRRKLPKSARPALLECWDMSRQLRLLAKFPEHAIDGRLQPSEFRKRLMLMLASFSI